MRADKTKIMAIILIIIIVIIGVLVIKNRSDNNGSQSNIQGSNGEAGIGKNTPTGNSSK